MNTETPNLPADRAVPTDAMNDRAIAGPDQDKRADYIRISGGSPAPEPLNRRGRRNLAAEIQRNERRGFRRLRRQAIAER